MESSGTLTSAHEFDYDLIVAGGGAAGFFGAIEVARLRPEFSILILEKSRKLLSKVRISGGGRCNVTHEEFDPAKLAKHYPRGAKWLRQAFDHFQVSDMVDWLLKRGVDVHTEEDGRIFPVSNDSQSIINCFLAEAHKRGVKIEISVGVERVTSDGGYLTVITTTGQRLKSRTVLIATGGSPNVASYEWLANLGHTVRKPLPSLFTFNDAQKLFADLKGIAVSDVMVRITGTKHQERGPVLITHWGLSGPAVIRLSAWAAEYLHETDYRFTVTVNWTGNTTEEAMRAQLEDRRVRKGKQNIRKNPMFSIPSRLWERLCLLSEIPEDRLWQDTSKRNINKLLENLIRCPFNMVGKTTFKEEFVTCGGVDLGEIDPSRMESKRVKDLFFAGEVINVDGETGGFNFQAAWTTAYIAAQAIAKRSWR